MLAAALSIAGLDPSGGAGLAADLRSFAVAGVWGTAVCAALTVQSTLGVRSVEPVAAELVVAQAEEVLADSRVLAFKTGALGSAENLRAVTDLLLRYPKVPAVVDPVMLPSRQVGEGRAALHRGGVEELWGLARAAALVTPNLRETAVLLGAEVAGAEAREAAVALVERGARAALVKGGHAGGAESIDWLATPGRVVKIARPRRQGPEVHGTGCTLASLVAGRLAARKARGRPDELLEAARWARSRLDRALASPLVTGRGQRVLAVGVRWPPAGPRRRA